MDKNASKERKTKLLFLSKKDFSQCIFATMLKYGRRNEEKRKYHGEKNAAERKEIHNHHFYDRIPYFARIYPFPSFRAFF